ncbi:polyphosphate kinase 2 [Campylobacter sp. LR264d]|uniref:polyphosphate kinase 2 n=1 Tax=Campylobacter sp. LR264d TaxID=2593544 RepID=UPI00123B6659|nr:polyphosphate kinase 2 [Campylobacter sp. LR264d]KAA6233736.1 polyphosphate kinase 2 [Campylobacter sp. LR264d]
MSEELLEREEEQFKELKDDLKDEKEENEKKENEKDNKKYVTIKKKKSTIKYENNLRLLQIELLKFQNYVKAQGLKVLLIMEGRDAAGKGGTIKRIIEHLNPRGCRTVALEKPSDVEKTQWYFQRYIAHLPSAGEIVIFDRSWYNRGGVEPVMGFCTPQQHKDFLREVPLFENMLVNSGIIVFKFYFSVSQAEQKKRFDKRRKDPLKQYKLSPVDQKSQELWDKYTLAKYSMLLASNTEECPWTIIRSDNKKKARLNTIRHMLSRVNYEDKQEGDFSVMNEDLVLSGEQEIHKMEANLGNASINLKNGKKKKDKYTSEKIQNMD